MFYFFISFYVKLTSTYDKTATVAAQISAVSSSVVFRAGTVTSLPPTLFVRAPNWFWKLCEGFFYFFLRQLKKLFAGRSPWLHT